MRTRCLSFIARWINDRARKSVIWRRGSISLLMRWKTFSEGGWMILLRIIMTSRPRSRKIFRLCTRICGAPKALISISWRFCHASSIPMELSYRRIYGFSKDSVDSSTLRSAFCLTLVPNPVLRGSCDIYNPSKTRILAAWLGSWALTPTSSHKKETKRNKKGFWRTVSFQSRRHNSSSTLYRTLLIRVLRVCLDFCTCYPARGLLTGTRHWSTVRNSSKTYCNASISRWSWTLTMSKKTTCKQTCISPKTESSVSVSTVNKTANTTYNTSRTHLLTRIRWNRTSNWWPNVGAGSIVVILHFSTCSGTTTIMRCNPAMGFSGNTCCWGYLCCWRSCRFWTGTSYRRFTCLPSIRR